MNDFGKAGLSCFRLVNLMIRAFQGETKQPSNLFFVIDDERGV